MGAYIILGIAAIGREIENPFGEDDNDLPLDRYCAQIADEINVISSKEVPGREDFIEKEGNRVMQSVTMGYGAWKARSTGEIRASLKARANEKLTVNLSMATAEKAGQDAV